MGSSLRKALEDADDKMLEDSVMIRLASMGDERSRFGPPIEESPNYWDRLSKAKTWMKDRGVVPITERVKK